MRNEREHTARATDTKGHVKVTGTFRSFGVRRDPKRNWLRRGGEKRAQTDWDGDRNKDGDRDWDRDREWTGTRTVRRTGNGTGTRTGNLLVLVIAHLILYHNTLNYYTL